MQRGQVSLEALPFDRLLHLQFDTPLVGDQRFVGLWQNEVELTGGGLDLPIVDMRELVLRALVKLHACQAKPTYLLR